MTEQRELTEEGLWVERRETVATVGISSAVLEEIGQVVYVSLPEIDRLFDIGEEIAVIESSKTAFDLYSPVTGRVIAVNESLIETTDSLNRDPEGDGWLYKIAIQTASSR